MKVKVICLSSMFLLAACGAGDNGEKDSVKASKPNKSSTLAKVSTSNFDKYLSEDKICSLFALEDVKTMFNAVSGIKTTPSSFMKTNSCDYSWDRADMEEREQNFLNARSDKAITMRQKVMSHSFNVALSETKQSKESFVPRKLSDEQLQAQIESAKKAAADRLTDEQKEIAGDAATSMIEGMLRKNNQNQKVDGVGDAAFWSNVGHGSLNVLSGNVKLVISVMISDTVEEDIENAKIIAKHLLK